MDNVLKMPERPASPITMDGLDRVFASTGLMLASTAIRSLVAREYALCVTTHPRCYDQNSDDAVF